MIPLHPVALGLVVVALVSDAGGWDLLADPFGWALVALGAARLPTGPPSGAGRSRVVVAALVALVVSAVLWPPEVAQRVADADASLAWALSLPQTLALLLLADLLRSRAQAHARTHRHDERARGLARWFLGAEVVAVLVALLPVLVLGVGLEVLSGLAALLALVLVLGTVVLCLLAAREPWAGGWPRRIPGSPTKSLGDS